MSCCLLFGGGFGNLRYHLFSPDNNYEFNGCVDGGLNNIPNKNSEPNSNPSQIHYIHIHVNTIEKVEFISLPSSYDLNKRADSVSSSGWKPFQKIDFDFKTIAILQDPQALSIVALRLTPDTMFLFRVNLFPVKSLWLKYNPWARSLNTN